MSSSGIILCVFKTMLLSLAINLSLIEIIGFESYNSQELLVGSMNLIIGLFGPTLFKISKKENENGKN